MIFFNRCVSEYLVCKNIESFVNRLLKRVMNFIKDQGKVLINSSKNSCKQITEFLTLSQKNLFRRQSIAKQKKNTLI